MARSARLGISGAVALALAAGAVLNGSEAPRPAAAEEVPQWPAVRGAAFAVRNASVSAPVVAFDTRGRELLAFSLAQRGRALFGRFHDLVCDGGSFHARDAGAWIGMQVAKSGAFTLEATLTPAEARPERTGAVLAYGDDKAQDAALLQDKGGLSLRLGAGEPVRLMTLDAGKTVQVLVTCDQGKWAAYRDGRPVGTGTAKAPAAWGSRELTVGAAWSGADTWRGRLEGIAVFGRALTAEEAAAEAAAIKALQAGRKAAAAIRFRGTLVRQAKTSGLEEIRPYTRSLTVAEYKVDKVLAGKWDKPTILVMHWMIIDGKRLPLADRKPGAAVELTVEPVEEHPQLESCRRDEIEGDGIAADLFYCESEPG